VRQALAALRPLAVLQLAQAPWRLLPALEQAVEQAEQQALAVLLMAAL
jgi:hypothetical protein